MSELFRRVRVWLADKILPADIDAFRPLRWDGYSVVPHEAVRDSRVIFEAANALTKELPKGVTTDEFGFGEILVAYAKGRISAETAIHQLQIPF